MLQEPGDPGVQETSGDDRSLSPGAERVSNLTLEQERVSNLILEQERDSSSPSSDDSNLQSGYESLESLRPSSYESNESIVREEKLLGTYSS